MDTKKVKNCLLVFLTAGHFPPTPATHQWQPTPVLLPGKFYGLRCLVGYSPWGCKESDMTKQLHRLGTRQKKIKMNIRLGW